MNDNITTFNLKSVKFKKGFPTIVYNTSIIGKEDSTYVDTITQKSPLPVSEDFKTSISDLSGVMYKVMGFDISAIVSDMDKLSNGDKKRLANINQQLEDNFQATGIVISGEDETKTVVIVGNILDNLNNACAVSTQPIRLSEDNYSIEDSLVEMVDRIEVECRAYIYEKKSPQIEMVLE